MSEFGDGYRAGLAVGVTSDPAPNVPGCTCPRFDESLDEGLDFPLCPMHERMLTAMRWSTVALLYIDLEAALYRLRALLATSTPSEESEAGT